MDVTQPAPSVFASLPRPGWNGLWGRRIMRPAGPDPQSAGGGPERADTEVTPSGRPRRLDASKLVPVNTIPQTSPSPDYAAPTARSLTAPLPGDEADASDAPRRHGSQGSHGPAAGENRSRRDPGPDDAGPLTQDGRAPDNLPHRAGPPTLHRPEGDPSRPGRRYCLITPCRDEQEFADATIRSVAGQSEPPSLWVVVDDGSTDRTPHILAQWQRELPYLRVIRRPDRGERKLGGGVIDAFYDGYAAIEPYEFDFVCKFDLDLELPPTYFADVMDVMAADERLGTFSGKPYFRSGGRLVSEMCGDENAVGMIKFYRVAAFEQIGGFVRELMWDGIDGHRCRMLGWRAESRDDPRLRFIHLRPMGTSHKSWWSGRQRHGRGQYFMGTGLAYMTASAVYRLTRPPRVIGGLAMMWGYAKSLLRGTRRYDDARFRRFVQRYQWRCLLLGKQRATRRVDAEQASEFRPPVLR